MYKRTNIRMTNQTFSFQLDRFRCSIWLCWASGTQYAISNWTQLIFVGFCFHVANKNTSNWLNVGLCDYTLLLWTCHCELIANEWESPKNTYKTQSKLLANANNPIGMLNDVYVRERERERARAEKRKRSERERDGERDSICWWYLQNVPWNHEIV